MTTVLEDPKHLILAAVSGGAVVGWAHAYVCCLVESDTFAELGGLVVDESHRGKGVGAMLLEKVEDWARQKGCAAVSARSNVIRHEAHKFYAGRGYDQSKPSMHSASGCDGHGRAGSGAASQYPPTSKNFFLPGGRNARIRIGGIDLSCAHGVCRWQDFAP
jgi:hypothetical protein